MEHIINLSMGKDSMAMTILMLEKHWPIDRVMFADVGEDAEFEETYEVRSRTERLLGISIETVRSNIWTWDKIFYSYPTRGKHKDEIRGFPPTVGPGCRYRSWLKTDVLDASRGNGNTIYIGIAADEAHRAQAKMYQDKNNIFRFPLIEWGMTEQDCFNLCKQRGLLHPLYKYFHRLGCWQCPKQRIGSLRNLFWHFPDKWEKLQRYQDACSWPFRPNMRVEDLAKKFIREEDLEEQQLEWNLSKMNCKKNVSK